MKEKKRARGVLLGEDKALIAALVHIAVKPSDELTWYAGLGKVGRG